LFDLTQPLSLKAQASSMITRSRVELPHYASVILTESQGGFVKQFVKTGSGFTREILSAGLRMIAGCLSDQSPNN